MYRRIDGALREISRPRISQINEKVFVATAAAFFR